MRDIESGGDILQLSDIAFFSGKELPMLKCMPLSMPMPMYRRLIWLFLMAGDCSDTSDVWFEFAEREIIANYHNVGSDLTSFLSLEECKELCKSHNVTEDYYRDYQCSGRYCHRASRFKRSQWEGKVDCVASL